MFSSLLNRRFTIFTGKGGVGKSTLATAVALAAARSGKRTLLIQFTAHDMAGGLLEGPEVGDEVVELAPNLYAVKPSSAAAMREYVALILGSGGKMAYRLVFENQLIKRFLRAIPGLNELLLLGKAFNHERERDGRGRPVWDRIILDAPATGHSVYLFQIPFVIRDAVSTGLMAREVRDMVSLLQDPQRTVLHLVTLPEEMPVNETLQLRDQLTDTMRIPLGVVIANGVFPRLYDDDERQALEALRKALPEDGDVLDRLVAAGTFRIERCGLQHSYLDRLRNELKLPLLEVPYYFVPSLGRDVIEDIAERVSLAVDNTPIDADTTLDEHVTQALGHQRQEPGA